MSPRTLDHCTEIAVLAIALSNAAGASVRQRDSCSTGGDILWNGASLTPQGHAGLYNLGKYGSPIFKSIRARSASAPPYSVAPIRAGMLTTGDVFGVRTNLGHYAKVMVTAADGASLSLEYTTFAEAGSNIVTRAAAAGPPPFITQVQNNYSFLLPGAPNYGIAPGRLFVIEGENLNGNPTPVLQSGAAPGLPATLNQTNVSVTVHGITTTGHADGSRPHRNAGWQNRSDPQSVSAPGLDLGLATGVVSFEAPTTCQ